MRIDALHPSSIKDDDWASWRAIRDQAAHLDSPYLAPEFTQIVGACRPDARVIVARDSAGSAFCFLPVQVSGFGLARPLGAPFADCHGPIVAIDALDALPSILEAAGLSGYRFTGMHDPDDVFEGGTRSQSQASVANLTPGYEVYLESRRSEYPKHFKKARRLGRQSAREAGELSLSFHNDDPSILRQLIGWKRDQFARTGLHDVLAASWVQDMFLRCFEAQSDSFSGVLTTLHFGEELAAAEFGIRSGKVLHGWLAGYNPEFANYSPGILLQERLLEAACERGIERADLGVGADHYKKYYASDTMALSEGVVVSSGLSGTVRGMIGATWMFAETSPIKSVAEFAGRAHRRLDNILAVETNFADRMSGVAKAFQRSRT